MTTAAWVGRVGGLAAALGVGAVIGFSTCAPASAAPADSADTADSAARADDRKASPARRAAARSAQPRIAARPVAAAASRVAPVSAVAPSSARVATNLVAETLAAPLPSVGAPREARKTQRAAAQQAPTQSAQGANITFPWCDPRGRQITIYKGTHFAIPNNGGYFITQTVGTGTFTTNSAYDLKDVDQYDWNKFTGIAFTPLEPDRNSAMVGWRYNLTTQEFEIAPFYNVDKVRILPNENPLSPESEYEVISVPAGETFEFDVDYSGITLRYGGKMVSKPYPPGLVANVWTAARVSGWFGGNEVAPRTISYFLRLN
jgi:hypothetical protein